MDQSNREKPRTASKNLDKYCTIRGFAFDSSTSISTLCSIRFSFGARLLGFQSDRQYSKNQNGLRRTARLSFYYSYLLSTPTVPVLSDVPTLYCSRAHDSSPSFREIISRSGWILHSWDGSIDRHKNNRRKGNPHKP